MIYIYVSFNKKLINHKNYNLRLTQNKTKNNPKYLTESKIWWCMCRVLNSNPKQKQNEIKICGMFVRNHLFTSRSVS